MNLEPAIVQLGATVTMYLAAAIAAGAALSALWLAGRQSSWSCRRLAAMRACELAGCAVALAACTAVLWLESAAMADVPLPQALPAVRSMLTTTHYGTAWAIGAAALALAGVLNLVAPRRLARLSAAVTMAALALFWYARSMVSHAASDGDASLAMLADWAHLALISAWVGGVGVAGMSILAGQAPGSEAERRDRVAFVGALSTSATVALAGILATGAFGVWHNVGSIADLLGNPYAMALLGKLAAVAVAVLLGGFNRFVVLPAWRASERPGSAAPSRLPRRFRIVLLVEAAVLFAALVMAVLLAGTPPPGSAT